MLDGDLFGEDLGEQQIREHVCTKGDACIGGGRGGKQFN
jgi:hypothetical protein